MSRASKYFALFAACLLLGLHFFLEDGVRIFFRNVSKVLEHYVTPYNVVFFVILNYFLHDVPQMITILESIKLNLRYISYKSVDSKKGSSNMRKAHLLTLITIKLLDFVHRPDFYKQTTQRFGK
jgi:hypothetical protein